MRRQSQAPTARETLFSYLLGGQDIAGKKIVDLFAGGGGVSLGIELALGRSPDVAINHDAEAIAMHQVNHPLTRHYQSDIFEVDPREAVGDAKVALMWLSPDCKHHSRAKGGRPLDQKIRSLAWVGLKWAGKVRPDVIILENVPDFQHWGRLVAQRGLQDDQGKKITPPWPNKPKRRGKTCRRWTRGLPAQRPPRGPVLVDDEGATLLVADKRPRYRGRTFRQFKKQLEALGYVVEHRTLRAHEYGAPTIRERFFLIARCDGKAISWPQATHGPGLLPVRTAAECIDWSIPTRTIFEQHARRRKDLEPSTLRRVAMGVNKYVLGTQRPFLVQCNHSGSDRHRPLDEPMVTVTSARDAHGLVTPYLASLAHRGHDHRQRPVDAPLGTVTGSGEGRVVVTPFLSPMTFANAPEAVTSPLTTITTQGNRHLLAAAHITKFTTGAIGRDAREPIGTICAGGNSDRPGASSVFGMVAAHIVRHNGGGLAPQHAGYAVDTPSRTVTAQGGPQALVSAALVQYNAANDAQPLDEPCRTVSTRDRYGLMTAHVLRQVSSSDARAVNAPHVSVTAGATTDGVITTHLVPGLDGVTLAGARRVYAFLAEYCPAALEKVDPDDRAAQLVTLVLDGETYVIWDIGMRMLEPRELYRCQSFPDSYVIDFSVRGRPLGKAAQVRMCGNSVPPVLVQAIVGAQFQEQLREAAD